MKSLFAFLVLLFVIQTPDHIDWSESRKLRWSDFKMKAPPCNNHAALTNSGMSMDLELRNNEFKVTVHAKFNPDKSWKKEGLKEEAYLLQHEQLHFDITELYARKLRKTFLERRWTMDDDFNSLFQDLYNANQDMLWSVQDVYDKETEHSILKAEQAKWNKAIADSLELYSDFSNPDIEFSIQ